MTQQDRRVQQEITDLWSATFGEQPAIEADPQTMIRILVACLKDPGPFEFGGQQPKPAAPTPVVSEDEAPGLSREVETPELVL